MNFDLTQNVAGSIPLRWVDEIFRRLTGRFGSQFTEKFRSGMIIDQRTGELLQPNDSMDFAVDSGLEEAKKVWAEELGLAQITPDQIKRGLLARHQYPPSCDEFIRECIGGHAADRDPEALFYRAQAEMQKRRDGRPDNWPSWGLFWAAASLGNDLLYGTFKGMEARWCVAMEANRDRSDPPVLDPEVAPKRIAMARLSPAEAADRLREIGGKVRAIGASAAGIKLEWARSIAEKTARGHYGNAYGQRMAAEAFVNLRQPVPPALVPFLAKTKPMEDAA